MTKFRDDTLEDIKLRRNSIIKQTIWEHRGFAIGWCLGILLQIGIAIGFICIIVHFAMKYW